MAGEESRIAIPQHGNLHKCEPGGEQSQVYFGRHIPDYRMPKDDSEAQKGPLTLGTIEG